MSFTYFGNITDSALGDPLPGATIKLIRADGSSVSQAADSNGSFSIRSETPGREIIISYTGYKTYSFPASEWQHNFELEEGGKVLDEVIVKAKVRKANKKFPIWLALLPLLLLIKNR